MYFQWVIFILSTMAAFGSVPDVLEYFPEIDHDASRVIWGHAINSKAQLQQALTSKDIMMMEADVSQGWLLGDLPTSKAIAIMAHPPNKFSDISLEMWMNEVLDSVNKGRRVGIKLDFKDLDIVMESTEMLKDKYDNLTVPVWLNADILPGPNMHIKPNIDADIFLSICTEFFPEGTLSLGWTTLPLPGLTERYSNEMVHDMETVMNKNHIKQPVTFAVRAVYVARSIDALQKLKKDKPETTFTVWTGALDILDYVNLAKFQKQIGKESVYFDLPPDEMEKLREEIDKLNNVIGQIPASNNPVENISTEMKV